MNPVRRSREERGFALIAVLWIVLLLSIIAASVIETGRTEASLARTRQFLVKNEALADGGIYLVIAELLDPRAAVRWRFDGTAQTRNISGVVLAISVQDERGKIDLNSANDPLLRGLFRSVGLSQDDASSMVDRVADWRDKGDLRRLNGAKAADYEAAGYSYGPRNSPFESVDELKLVMGMTPTIFQRVEPALTVYSGLPNIDPLVAPKEALLALPDMTLQRSEAMIRARQGSADPSAPSSDVAVSFSSVSGTSLDGRAFLIRSGLAAGDGSSFWRQAIIRITGDRRSPYWVYLWNSHGS